MIIVLVLTLKHGCHVPFVRKWRKCGEAFVKISGGYVNRLVTECTFIYEVDTVN